MSDSDASRRDAAWAALGEAWVPVLDYVAEVLNRDGVEGAVLSKLANYPRAAFDIAWSESTGDNPYYKAIGAVIPGFVPRMRPEALGWVWNSVCELRKSSADDSIEAMVSNSLAERVLTSAVRWARHPDRREPAIAVMQDMVERAIGGVHWNDAHWAAATLLNLRAPGAAELVARLANSAVGREHFRPFLEQLAAGDRTCLIQGELLADDEAWRSVVLPADRAREVEAFLRACARWESLSGDEGA